MASRGEELLISADSHIIEDPHFWENRLPAAFKEQAPVFPEREVGGLFQAHAGGWDPRERVKEMAVDGVSGEVLYPSFAMNLFGLQDAALQEACFRVYNDWIQEYCSVAPDRLTVCPVSPLTTSTTRWRSWGAAGRPACPGHWCGRHRRPSSLSPPSTTSACGRWPRIWRCRSASTSLQVSPSLGRARSTHVADARPLRPCAAPSTTNCSTRPTPCRT